MEPDIKIAMRLIEKICVESGEDGILGDIYQIAHCFSESCKNPHEDWKEMLNKMIKEEIYNKQ